MNQTRIQRMLSWVVFFMVTAFIYGACGEKKGTDSPKKAVKAFMAAVEMGNKKRVWKLLGPETQELLKLWAREANQNHQTQIKPMDLLSPATRLSSQTKWKPKSFKVIKKDSKQAIVEVSSPAPKNTLIHLDGVSVGWVAGSLSSLHFSRPPQWTRHHKIPLLGLNLMVSLDQTIKTPSLLAGHRDQIRLVRHNGHWRVELDLKKDR